MDLSKLPVADGVHQRGKQVARLETFVDAAFAFAVTLLVISFDSMPSSFDELYSALRRLPEFLAGFAILALFWNSHNALLAVLLPANRMHYRRRAQALLAQHETA